MIIEETINKFIRDIVNNIVGNDSYSIRGRQNAPRPSTPYCDIEYLSGLNIGIEEQKLIDNDSGDLDEIVSGQREIIFSLNFHKESAYDNASKVRSSLVLSNILQLFLEADIGLIRRSEVRDLSEAFENGFEERAQFDLFLNIVSSIEGTVNAISSIDISGIFQSNEMQNNITINN